MITDNKRREVAQKLRSLACTPDEIGITEHAVVSTLGISAGIYDDSCRSEDVLIVADLIDRPTCEMKSILKSSYRVCSRCGTFVRKDAATNCTEVIPVRFCPFCGRKLMKKDDE